VLIICCEKKVHMSVKNYNFLQFVTFSTPDADDDSDFYTVDAMIAEHHAVDWLLLEALSY